MSFIRNDSKLVQSKASGTPNVGITSSTSTELSPLPFGQVWKTIGHFVNKSWNTMFPLGSSIMSTPTIWNGLSVTMGCSGGFCCLLVPNCTMAHLGQLLA